MTTTKQSLRNIFTQFKPGQRFYVFTISITLASAFWLLNALNKTYNKNVNVVIKYINKPSHLAFSRIPPRTVEVEVRGDGFSLLQIENEVQNDTAVIDLSTLAFEQSQNKKRASISSKTITNKIQGSLSNNMFISRVSVDSIAITLEPSIRKQVFIQPNINVVLANGLTLEVPISADPNYVEVFGPASKLQEIDTLFTDFVDFGEISKSSEAETRIIYDKNVLLPATKTVNVQVRAEQITEGEISVPLQVITADSLRVRLLPEEVKIKYTTGLSHFDDITPALFQAQVFYKSTANAPSKLPVVVNEVPNFINVLSISPERVDYLLMNKR